MKYYSAMLVIGFFYRLYLASSAYSTPIFDMYGYHEGAKAMLSGMWYADCCLRNGGYSAFLTIPYYFFGQENLLAVRVIQIILDLTTAFFVYRITRSFAGDKTAMLAYVLYVINPFTASYTGLRLSEILTIFLLTSIVYIVQIHTFRRSRRLWLMLGFLLGLLLFVKLSFYYFVFVSIAVLSFFMFKKYEKLVFFMLCITGFLLGSSYSLISYYTTFGEIRLTPPYAHPGLQLYGSFFIPHYPETGKQYEELGNFPYEYTRTMIEYEETPNEKKEALDKKYIGRFWEMMRTDWPIFLSNTIRNIWWIWDKTHIYYYDDPFYPQDKWPLRILNSIFLILSFVGFLSYIIHKKWMALHSPVVLFTCLLFVYISFFFSLTNNESRFSYYFFPLLFVWAGYGIAVIARMRYGRRGKTDEV